MSIVVLATIRALPEHRDEVIEALKNLAITAHTEIGVERFVLLEGEGDLLIIEKWVDQAAMDAHTSAPISVETREILAGKLLEAPEHKYLRTVPSGDPRIGAL